MTDQHDTYHESRELEQHFHHQGTGTKWFGWDGVAGGQQDGSTCYQLTCGNDDFGDELLILDAGDTPVDANYNYFDPQEIVVCDTNQEGLWYIKFYIDTGSGDFVDAEVLTTVAVSIERITNRVITCPVPVGAKRSAVGLKIWAEAKCAGQNAKTIDFIVGLHEYIN